MCIHKTACSNLTDTRIFGICTDSVSLVARSIDPLWYSYIQNSFSILVLTFQNIFFCSPFDHRKFLPKRSLLLILFELNERDVQTSLVHVLGTYLRSLLNIIGAIIASAIVYFKINDFHRFNHKL